MICKPTTRPWSIFLGVSSLFLMLMAYTWLSHRQHIINPDDTTMPSWSQIKEGVTKIHTLQRRSEHPWIIEDSKASIFRLGIGWGGGVVIATILGILMGCYRKVEAFLSPIFSLAKQCAPTAMIAVFFILLGTKLQMFAGVIMFGVIPIMALSVCMAVKDVPQELIYKSYTLGATNTETIWHVIFFSVLPKVIDVARLQIGPAVVFLIAAEWAAANVGFGFRLRLQSRLINMNVVYPYIFYLAMFGYAVDFSLVGLRKLLCPWYGRQ